MMSRYGRPLNDGSAKGGVTEAAAPGSCRCFPPSVLAARMPACRRQVSAKSSTIAAIVSAVMNAVISSTTAWCRLA